MRAVDIGDDGSNVSNVRTKGRTGTMTKRVSSVRLSDGSKVSVRYIGTDWEGMGQYRWTVRDNDGRRWTGTDLRTDVGMDRGAVEMLGTLCTFLGAFAESRSYGTGPEDSDNWDLFPDTLADWAMGASDELAMVTLDIEEA